MKNLFKVIRPKTKEQEMIQFIEEDFKWEKDFQEYYNTLIYKFHNFIEQTYEKLKLNGLSVHDKSALEGSYFEIPHKLLPFFERSSLGVRGPLGNGPEDNINITFRNISLYELVTRFYGELQRIEIALSSPEIMQRNYDIFTANNISWITKRKETIKLVKSTEVDEKLEEYYDHLKILYYDYEILYNPHNGCITISNNFNNPLAHKAFLDFIKFYNLGFEMNGTFIIIASQEEVRTAYFQEMQRLEHLGAKKTLKLK